MFNLNLISTVGSATGTGTAAENFFTGQVKII